MSVVTQHYRNWWQSASALLMTTIVCAAMAFAQGDTGQITDRVTDPNGAAIPGATVTIKARTTGATRSVTTDKNGFFYVAYLQPGLYEVTVQAAGFAEKPQGVEVALGVTARTDIALSVTPVTGQAEISEGGGGVTVNTQNQQLSNQISGRQIRVVTRAGNCLARRAAQLQRQHLQHTRFWVVYPS
jgi:hypothetical protein